MTSTVVHQADLARDRAVRRLRRAKRRTHRSLLRVSRRVQCPVCGWHGLTLMASQKPRRPNRICPSCGSSERYRALDLWMRRKGAPARGARLLEIAPIETVRHTAEDLGYRYTSLDLHSPRALVRGDLCRLPFADASFDLVICFHVLEHVPDDATAAAELARAVGSDGTAMVVVPWDVERTTTFEDPDADPADYERLYGQSDHVRIYGADAPERWRRTGTSVREERWEDDFSPDARAHHALEGDDDRFWFLSAPA